MFNVKEPIKCDMRISICSSLCDIGNSYEEMEKNVVKFLKEEGYLPRRSKRTYTLASFDISIPINPIGTKTYYTYYDIGLRIK